MKWLLAFVAGLAWATAVFGAYYASHKPAETEVIARIPASLALLGRPWHLAAALDTARQFFVVAALVLAAWLLGRLLLPARADADDPSTGPGDHLMAVAVGLGALSLAVFALGLAGLLRSGAIAIVLAAPAVATAVLRGRQILARKRAWEPGAEAPTTSRSVLPVRSWRFSARTSVHRGSPTKLTGAPLLPINRGLLGSLHPRRLQAMPPLDLALLGYLIVTLGLTTVAALAPPTGWDGLVYHLTGPKLYLAQGRIFSGLDGVHFYFPPLVDMLYLAGMALAGDVTSQILHTAMLAMATGAVYTLAAGELGRRAGLLAAALFLSAPTWLLLAQQPYVDGGLALFVTLAFSAAHRWTRTRSAGWLILSAALTGFALGIKYTAAVFAVGIAVTLLLTNRPRSVGPLIRWAMIAGLVAAPWYLKNLVFTGNPVYPFLFGGWNWDAWRAAWYGQPGTGLLAEPVRLLIVPWEMTILGAEGRVEYQATIGPLLLATFPLTLVGRRPGLVNRVLVFTGTVFALWLVGLAEAFPTRQTRLVMPSFGLLAIAAAWGVERLEAVARPALNPRRIAMALVMLALGLSLVGQVVGLLAQMPAAYVLGAETREEYLSRLLRPHYPAMQTLRTQTPPEARVYFLWEPRSYYAERAVQSDQLLDNWTRPLDRLGSSERIWRWLRGQGYTHVLIYRGGLDYLLRWQHGEITVEQAAALVDFERRFLLRLVGPPLELAADAGVPSLVMPPGGDYALYAIRD